MNTFGAKILADSIAPHDVRLLTLEVTMPRIVLAEFNTHRKFARNAASSRAIPVHKRIQAARDNPFVPEFAANQAGMQAGEALTEEQQQDLRTVWLNARDSMCECADYISKSAHKQWANRLLEPFSWVTDVVSSTDWANFFALRISPLAQPEFFKVATLMNEVINDSSPKLLTYGEWHLPLIKREDVAEAYERAFQADETGDQTLREVAAQSILCDVSVARCARVSYLTHDGKRDMSEDLRLYKMLTTNGHWSPLEHVATPVAPDDLCLSYRLDQLEFDCDHNGIKPIKGQVGYCGNFCGWKQRRKFFKNECIHDR